MFRYSQNLLISLNLLPRLTEMKWEKWKRLVAHISLVSKFFLLNQHN